MYAVIAGTRMIVANYDRTVTVSPDCQNTPIKYLWSKDSRKPGGVERTQTPSPAQQCGYTCISSALPCMRFLYKSAKEHDDPSPVFRESERLH